CGAANMVDDRRVIFVTKWLRWSREATDELHRFFSAWIALVVAAQRIRDSLGRPPEEDSDRQRVVDYFLAKKADVMRAVGRHKEEMRWIAHRRGTRHTNAIVDTGNPNLRDLLTQLSRYYVAGH